MPEKTLSVMALASLVNPLTQSSAYENIKKIKQNN